MREFNTEGVCVPEMHYMVNIKNKISGIEKLIEKNKYFTINRARQYGKATTFSRLYNKLKDKYLVISISFEGLGDDAFCSAKEFIDSFIRLIAKRLKKHNVDAKIIAKWENNSEKLIKLDQLSERITQLVDNIKLYDSRKEIILFIDEVDKSANNQLFLQFLGMLRNKYLERTTGDDTTFKSVILAGVHDIKNIKSGMRPEEDKKYNSPWNIAADFYVDMSFNPIEIATMLIEYEADAKTGMDIQKISEEIYKYTSGYPFLVSKICKIIDERVDKIWTIQGIEEALKKLFEENNTLFDDLIKNLENNKDLYNLVLDMLLSGGNYECNRQNPVINIGLVYGIFGKSNNDLELSNKIFESCIYNYLISKTNTEKGTFVKKEIASKFITNGSLDMELVLTKFQELMQSEYRTKDTKFIEREGRLLFLCFIKPIINGKGFYYVEPETRMSNRMDVVVTYGGMQYIIELKIWRGDSLEQEAVKQLAGYLESRTEKTGYLVSFSFNKEKKYTNGWKKYEDKDIFAVVV